ncbi:CTP:phosphocholine cytidylyltransferase [Lachnospiraceae bacterium XBB2008]|nr:CTP:phosphocholine cytidylyltransferase [Lachnospiraceae bacterium XBB2008]
MKVDNAIILAAGTSSRFAPLSFERHKGLTVVKNEVLIERQIVQIKAAGVSDIYIVTGYKAEQFEYLKEKYGVRLIYNPDYLSRNNNGSIWAVRDLLSASYICSADNYFLDSPFEAEVDESYYAAEYAEGHTFEWCMEVDGKGYISNVSIGGADAWYMMGHTFWSPEFSHEFLDILAEEYNIPGTQDKLWERIFMAHLDRLKMKIRKYPPGMIFEFDTLDELRHFDNSYIHDTHSSIIKTIAKSLNVFEKDVTQIHEIKGDNAEAVGFRFVTPDGQYKYMYHDCLIIQEV